MTLSVFTAGEAGGQLPPEQSRKGAMARGAVGAAAELDWPVSSGPREEAVSSSAFQGRCSFSQKARDSRGHAHGHMAILQKCAG